MLMIPKPQTILTELNNWNASPSSSIFGISVPAHATIHTKSAWVEMFAAAALTYDVYGISVVISNDALGATAVGNIYDIGVGAAAAEVVLIPDILNSGPVSVRGVAIKEFYFPIFIPKGTRIAARHQSSVTVQPGNVSITLHGSNGMVGPNVFAGCDSYGADLATSKGTSHTVGNNGSYSAWANLGATLTRDYSALQLMATLGSAGTLASLSHYWQIGVNSTLLRHYMSTQSTSEDLGWIYPVQPLYGNFALGTQIMMRGQCSGTADNLTFGFLAFY